MKGKPERPMTGFEEDVFKARRIVGFRPKTVRQAKRLWNQWSRHTWRQRHEKEEGRNGDIE